ncbi:hypothetical protein CMO88_01040 [Candidatus Woesearchaeota archaeon]|nr:hypothetical protein [Candidatus Woesearchaeota archaeon]
MDKALKSEIIKLSLMLVVLAVVMKIVFYKQDLISTTRTALALFWMFALPGYAMLYYWKEKLDFAERIVIGTAAAAAVVSIASYYLGLIGLQVKYHGIVLPAAMLIISAVIMKKKKVA